MSGFISSVIVIAIAVVFALVCRSMAKSRNRSQNLWTVLGFFFPLISLIILLIMGNDKSKSLEMPESNAAAVEVADDPHDHPADHG